MESSTIKPNLVADTPRQDDAALAHAAALSGPRVEPPARVAGYEIVRCLGEGAYGSVWLAAEQNTGKQVAIKFYSHRRGLDWSLLNREVEKLAVLYTSREIIGLLAVGWDADPPYYVMEYLAHGSLAKRLEAGPLPVAEAVRIATAVAQALVHAHKNDILHCDLKPANVLLDSHDSPRLADFGQSRLSYEQSPALGTLFYMAPEQADLTAIPDARWDVYALGALLYHALCGDAPYRTPENEARIRAAVTLEERLTVYRQIIAVGPKPAKHRGRPGVDARLADIVDRCLEPDPGKRFSSVQKVVDALEERVRLRSRRPLVTLGIVGPGLLLLALMPLVWKAMDNAARTAEINLAGRAVESDLVSAKILALAVEQGLEERMFQLREVAANGELRAAIAAAQDKPAGSPERRQVDELLSRLKDESDRRLDAQQVPRDDSWFLNDARGVQRWRGPPSPATFDVSFAHRDYFHGRGFDYDEQSVPANVRPIDRPHFSRAYQGTTGDKYKVAISVPVFDVARKEVVIGVLARTILLGQLLVEYKERIRGDGVDRIIAMVDLRSWKLLDHPWMTGEHMQHLPEEKFEKLSVNDPQRSALERLARLVEQGQPSAGEERDLKYHDPVGTLGDESSAPYHGEWLAAFWPIQNTRWMAVVQERRDEALQPVREIHSGLVRYALGGLFLCFALVATLWIFEMRVMSERVGRSQKTVGGDQ